MAGSKPVFMPRRFDRSEAGRVPFISAMAMLNGRDGESYMPAVMTPLAAELAQTTGFSLNAVLMTQVIGFSTVVFPYQVGPLIVAMGLAGESTRPLLKILVAVAGVTVLVLLPLEYLWWKGLALI